MADMVLRKLDDSIKQRLRERAARNGRSMAAEVREILRVALEEMPIDPNAEFKQRAASLRALTAGRPTRPRKSSSEKGERSDERRYRRKRRHTVGR
jgi:phosphopantothenoylcysteine decarboxylase/phosphopantothenate--cysteine ligase